MNTNNRILIIGGGIQASYVIDIIEENDFYNIIGIIDSKAEIGTMVYGYKVIGRQENIKELCEQYEVGNIVIAIGDNYSRFKVYEQINSLVPNIKYPSIIHKSVIISNKAQVGIGVVIMAGVIINCNAIIYSFVFLATGCQIEHDCKIHPFSSVSANSTLGGFVRLGIFSAITLNCTIFDRVAIGKNTVIGSASLVTKDIGDNELWYGSPAKHISNREHGDKFLK
jgi:sugar O-acyltransferase (sialic acid O-acetyltransferase NeuD family)